MTGYLYCATPYALYPAGLEEAYRIACQETAALAVAGLAVFSPIAHGHGLSRYGRIPPTNHELWMAINAPFMEAASGLIVVMMEGWRQSKGIAAEIEEFERAGKPVFHMTPGAANLMVERILGNVGGEVS